MKTIHSYLVERSIETPNFEGLVDRKHRYTFKQYNEEVNRLAHYMKEKGVKKGDRVALLLENTLFYPVALFASFKVGAIAIPTNSESTTLEMENVIDSAKATLVLYDEKFANVMAPLIEEKGDVIFKSVMAQDESLEGFQQFLKSYSTDEPNVVVNPEDPALFLFTSGTTGKPKICEIIHKTYTSYFESGDVSKWKNTGEGARFLAVHPLFHMSSLISVFGAAFMGMTVVCSMKSEPKQIWEVIQDQKINSMMAFPYVYNHMIEEYHKGNYDASSLKQLQTGGTKVPSSLFDKYKEIDVPLLSGYGSTEAFVLTRYVPSMGREKADSAGLPVDDIEIKIVDKDTHEPLEKGQVGEILIRSPYVFEGYWGNEEATEKAFEDGWFLMGDAGMIDEDGFLYIMGRYKDVIVYGGENIYPDGVEEVLTSIKGVREAAVVGVKDETFGEVPKAFIVKQPGSPLSEEDVLSYCKGRLSDYKIPAVEFVESLPKNPVGKVLKNVLRDRKQYA
ncbi:class I adenylate-forming enzyme family protein [Priestia filamentosa]|uniref:class I adenylate-forming enzyme family protein n=1 Tax=Priestia filamentosa TaxID=1402861 RepID=UPI002E1D30B1|nr:class I adenylate-forming enzyme family protein [Priestia filamentosa]